MKNLFRIISFLVLLIFIFSGCSESDTENLPPPPTLEFDTEGDYDLSEYLFPDKNQTNIYEKKVYVNSEGKREYASVDANESNYNLKFIKNNNKTEEYYGVNLERKLHKEYIIEETKVVEHEIDMDRNISIARYVDVGDPVIENTSTVRENGNEVVMTLECKLDSTLSEKNGYEDIAILSCSVDENYEMIFLDKKGEVRSTGTIKAYYAKNIGMIEFIEDVCEDTYFSEKLVESECVKTVRSIIQVTD